GAPAHFDRRHVELLQGVLPAAAVQGADLPAGEVPRVDDPRSAGYVVDARGAQQHLALPGKRTYAGDAAESGPLGPRRACASRRCAGPADEAHAELAEAGPVKAAENRDCEAGGIAREPYAVLQGKPTSTPSQLFLQFDYSTLAS